MTAFVVPDADLRRALIADLRPQAEFWDETVPVFGGWPDAPCGYMRFAPNPSYDQAARDARLSVARDLRAAVVSR